MKSTKEASYWCHKAIWRGLVQQHGKWASNREIWPFFFRLRRKRHKSSPSYFDYWLELKSARAGRIVVIDHNRVLSMRNNQWQKHHMKDQVTKSNDGVFSCFLRSKNRCMTTGFVGMLGTRGPQRGWCVARNSAKNMGTSATFHYLRITTTLGRTCTCLTAESTAKNYK